jgi:competence protein ComEC
LIAVSGSHLVVIATLLAWVLTRLPGNRALEIALLALFLAAFVRLTGLQPSAIRAAVMTVASASAFFVRRRAHSPSSLCVAACAMLALHAPNAFSVGFWLSVFAVLGLTLFCPLVRGWLAAVPARLRKPVRGGSRVPVKRSKAGEYLLESLALTGTAQLATLPLTIPIFAMVSFAGPLANLIAVPLMTLMVGGGIIALVLALLLPVVAMPALQGLSLIGELLAAVANVIASIPYASLPVTVELVPALLCSVALAVLLFALWPRPRRWLARSLCLLLLAVAVAGNIVVLPTGPQLVMMDIGQGDALLVRDGTSAVLIDTGEHKTPLLQALARNRVNRLDAVIITHLHEDHCGALDTLRGTVATERVFVARGLPAARSEHKGISGAAAIAAHGRAEELTAGDRIRLSEHLWLDVVAPVGEVAKGDNADSICCILAYDADGDGDPEQRGLLTGDAEAPQLEELDRDGLLDDIALFKVGHHGSKIATTPELLRTMRTRLALISCGEGNRYGHPKAETLAMLEEADVAICRTDINGDITVSFNRTALTVSCATMTPDIT